MDTTATVRQAKLRPESAQLYPTLPASMWTSAASLTQLVVSCRATEPERPGGPQKSRTLSDADFEFRGGRWRWSDELSARTRLGELEIEHVGATFTL